MVDSKRYFPVSLISIGIFGACSSGSGSMHAGATVSGDVHPTIPTGGDNSGVPSDGSPSTKTSVPASKPLGEDAIHAIELRATAVPATGKLPVPFLLAPKSPLARKFYDAYTRTWVAKV